MSKSLATYLEDHLVGAQIAVQLLEAMHTQNDEARFREFAGKLLPEIREDHQILRTIAQELGTDPGIVKQAGGWLLEKASRLKLGHTGSADFGMFQSLELLALGIQGKLALWKALRAVVERNVDLREYDFENLIARAERQFAEVESQRLGLARSVLADQPS